MKKQIVAIALLLGCFGTAQAQKYMTRTGKISFYSHTPIENIEAFNNEVSCIIDSKAGSVLFQAPVKSFKFEKETMQEHFNEDYMESDKFPKSDFKGSITNISAVNFSKDGTYKVSVSGKLTMHGVTKDVTTTGTVTVKGKEITANTKFDVSPKDYNMKVPANGKIADKIEITVNSVLTAM